MAIKVSTSRRDSRLQKYYSTESAGITAAVAPDLWTFANTTMFAWWKSDDLDTITHVDDLVSQHDDKSGNARHITQATGSLQPITNTNTLDSRNVLHYLEDRMAKDLGGFQTPTDIAIFVVARRVAVQSASCVFLTRDSGETHDWNNTDSCIYFFENTGTDFATFRDGFLSNGTHPGNGVAYMADSTFDGVENIVSINGTAETPVASIESHNFDILDVNARWSGGSYSTRGDNDIAEIGIIVGSITTDIYERAQGYLAWEWGLEGILDAGHTYKAAAPTV